MIEELADVFQAAASDPDTRCIILTGAGEAFCAGQDLKEPIVPEGGISKDQLLRAWTLLLTITATTKPVIGAINGVAAGAGVSLALACDLRLAADTSRFVPAFLKIGLIPDLGATFMLPRIVGALRAYEFFLSGESCSAQRAAAIGLVNRVVPKQALDEEAEALAVRVAKLPAAAVGALKEMIIMRPAPDLNSALDREAETQVLMVQTKDHLEAVAAFRARRPQSSDQDRG